MHRVNSFRAAGEEPKLQDVMQDPIVHLVMARDQVSERQIRELIENARHALNINLCG